MAKVLIADESAAVRRNLKVLLTQIGHTVISEASNGVQAFVEYREKKPDIVTMDITMPIMNGIDSIKKIISHYPDARIIIISAVNQKSLVFEALKSGAKHYIVKPIDAQKLNEVINNVLGLNTDTAPIKVQQQNLPPFSIEKLSGNFIVNINETMNRANVRSFQSAVEELLTVNPLNVTFSFGTSSFLESEVICKIADTINTVKNAGGLVSVASEDEGIIEFIVSKKYIDLNYS